MQSVRILLVEDEFLIAFHKQKQLEEYGYFVEHVSSGEEAIALIFQDELQIDLILMDINITDGMDGTEAAKVILENKEIPIIFFSSHTEQEVVRKTEAITSYGYVLKQASIVVLDASIKMALKLFEAKLNLNKIDFQRSLEKEETELRVKRQRATIANLVSDQIVFGNNLEMALNQINKYLAKTLDVKRSGIWILNDTSSELQSLSLLDAENNTFSKGWKLKTSDFPEYFKAILVENRIYSEDAFNDPRTQELKAYYLQELGVTSLLDAGFFINRKLKGVICSEHIGVKRKWHPDEESFVSTVAAVVGQVFMKWEQTMAQKVSMPTTIHQD